MEDAQRAVTFLFEYAEIQCSVSCRMSTVAVSTVRLDSCKLAARFTVNFQQNCISTELHDRRVQREHTLIMVQH